MKILAEDLSRLCYNAIQFSAKDSSLGGVVAFRDCGSTVEVYASDDYVAMADRADWTPEGMTEDAFHLGLKDLKELEKALRVVEGEQKISIEEDALVLPWGEPFQFAPEPPDFTDVIEVVHSEPNPFTGEYSPSAEPFAIRGERFTKFRLLRTPESPSCKDGYPVDFLWDGQMIRWKCGPMLRGVVGPLARRSFKDQISGVEVTGIKDLYAEESEVLW